MWSCRPTSTRSSGFGLLELVVSAALLTLLIGLQLLLIGKGSSTWHKVDTQAQLQQSLQAVLARVVREAQGSTWAGVSVAPNILSLVSAHHNEEPMALGSGGYLLWKRFCVFYLEAGEIRLALHAWPAPGEVPRPIEQFDFGDGLRPLTFYAREGQRLASDVTRFEVSREQGMLLVQLSATRRRYGSQRPEVASFRQEVFLRN